MRILHIGDLHYKQKNQYEQVKVITSLIETLKTNSNIDIVLFSGDLVNDGSKKDDFLEAHKMLFDGISKALNLPLFNFFICAGNHDIDRNIVINSIITNFSDKKSIDRKTFETWYAKQIADKNASLNPSNNFYNYHKDSFDYPTSDLIDVLFSTHIRDFGDKKIGIVTFNTAWFCSGERDDKNQLLIVPQLLEDAIVKIESCDIKILMQHHPLNFLKESISYEIEDLVHSNFNVLLLGHVHKEFIETQFRCNNGICCNTTKASLCGDGGEMGFTILNFDFDDLSNIKSERFSYIKTENKFYPIEPVLITIPLGEEKHKQNTIRKKIKSKIQFELNEANKLLLDYDEKNERIFIDTFTQPILSKDSDEETIANAKTSKFPYENLIKIEDNYLIFGKDKCGKTSLLRKIKIDLLQSYSNKSLIPFYIDYKQIESTDNEFDIFKMLSVYYQITRAEAIKIINDGKLVLLIDNLNTTSSLHNKILEILENNEQIRFIICSEYLTSRIFAEELDGLAYEKYFFKNLSRTDIRNYTQKLPSIKKEDQDLIIEKVANFCKQLQLPLNYWTVSLIILIYKKGNDDYSKNLFSVLDACVDEILQKKKFLFEKTNLKFEQYKSLCSEIAKTLFKDYSDFEYSCTFQELLTIIEKYKEKNPRIVTNSNEIANFLFECGIFKKKQNSNYTFRLNGIFEYFLAYHIKENEIFKAEILDNSASYLAFKNELEIYSGFNRSDVSFLKKIFLKTKDALTVLNSTYSENPDKLLLNKIDNAYYFDKSFRKLLVESPLSENQRDSIFDNNDVVEIDSDVHLKKMIEPIELNVEIVEKYITILARVLKNSDGITDSVLIYEIFDYLLNCYCQFGFYIIDDFEKNAKEENLKLREEYELEDDYIIGEQLLKVLSKILPVLVQAMMYDGLGHLNFAKIIEDKIREYRTNSNVHQYKLFVLYFLLIDTDIKTNKTLIDDVIEEIKLAPLKIATIFKLNFYLAFKAYNNKTLEEFIKLKIQTAQLKIDSKVDVGELQKSLSKQSKKNLVLKKRN